MKKFKDHITEAKKSTVVVSFGRMNPMTNGHEKLANKIKSEAASRNADAKLYLSHSTNPKKDPLPFDAKVKFATKAFGPMVQHSAARTIIEVAKELSGKYSDFVVVVGSDRIPEFKTLLNKYNGKEFNFDSIEIVSAGERDPDAEGVEGMSGSKMRKFAADEDFANFKKGVPSKLSDADAKQLYDAVRKGMKLDEAFAEFMSEGEQTSSDYKLDKRGRKYPAHRIVLGKRKGAETADDEDKEDVKEAVLNFSQRMMRASRFKRIQKRVQRARMLSMRRYASTEKLKQRSMKLARNFIRMRFAGGKQYSSLSTGEKISLDARLQKMGPSIKKLAARLMPTVRQKETLRHVVGPAVKEDFEINELAYQGNIGAMEMFAFFQKATDEQKKQMKDYIKSGRDKDAWKLIHKVTGVKLVGPQFEDYSEYGNEEEDDETEIDGLEMAQIELSAIIEDAKSLLMIINSMDEEPEAWVQSKISLATDYISSVRDYLEFSEDEEEDEDEEDEPTEDDYKDAEYAMAGMETEEYDPEIKSIIESVTSLQKKAEKAQIDYSIIREVYYRGMKSWNEETSTLSQQQWAFSRVNSFICGGPTTKDEDADLFEMVDRNEKFTKFAESVLEYGTDAARMAYARTTPGQSQEITMARYSANTALDAINNANIQRQYKLYSEEACCEECKDEIVEEVDWDLVLHEAQYQGKDVKLNDPFRTPGGPKKFAVYTTGENGKVVIVRFGDPNMEIKRDDPSRRASFRARHNCDDPGPKWKARYWSCHQWRASAKVDN